MELRVYWRDGLKHHGCRLPTTPRCNLYHPIQYTTLYCTMLYSTTLSVEKNCVEPDYTVPGALGRRGIQSPSGVPGDSGLRGLG